MATQTIRQDAAPLIPADRREIRRKITDFFSPAVNLLDLYFGGPWRLDYQSRKFRAGLSVKDRVVLDADLLGITSI